jgi:hypothetical protein
MDRKAYRAQLVAATPVYFDGVEWRTAYRGDEPLCYTDVIERAERDRLSFRRLTGQGRTGEARSALTRAIYWRGVAERWFGTYGDRAAALSDEVPF